jgi:hypothetical protein
MPKKSDLRYIYGMPKYQESNSVKHGTTIYFSIDDMYLDTGYTPLLGGTQGGEIYRNRIDLNFPVNATFFIVKTRLGLRVYLLNTIEQKGRIIVSEADTYFDRYNSYISSIALHYFLPFIFGVLAIIFYLINKHLRRG